MGICESNSQTRNNIIKKEINKEKIANECKDLDNINKKNEDQIYNVNVM